jgi:hypothetical protein
MNLRQQYQVLVLSVVCAAIAWVGGCAGVAEPLPSLSVTPNILSVSAKVGTSSAQAVSVTNIGTGPVSVQQAIVTGSGFSLTGLTTPITLAANQTQTFSVKFTAGAAGTVNGSLAIMTDSQHRPVVMSLKGNGTSASPSVASVSVTPPAASPAPNAKVQFTAAVQGSTTNEAVTWTASTGTITSNGMYTAPSASATGMVTATSVADPSKSASAVVTVAAASNPGNPSNPPSGPGVTSVTVTPSTASATTGSVLTFKASVQGSTTNLGVIWHASSGTISSGGVFTAPSSAGTSIVTAASVADPTKIGSASITVTAPPTNNPPSNPSTPSVSSVTVSPGTASSVTGGTLPFSATVAGSTSNKSVTWKAALGTSTLRQQRREPIR